ncbi:hypothetical protein B0H14DRAFT_3457746 [Mycena olivaceomarginata]|nr:hypothetical protein B0H14DRAFT_3457746 [Mycena olivaceomarginata]
MDIVTLGRSLFAQKACFSNSLYMHPWPPVDALPMLAPVVASLGYAQCTGGSRLLRSSTRRALRPHLAPTSLMPRSNPLAYSARDFVPVPDDGGALAVHLTWNAQLSQSYLHPRVLDSRVLAAVLTRAADICTPLLRRLAMDGVSLPFTSRVPCLTLTSRPRRAAELTLVALVALVIIRGISLSLRRRSSATGSGCHFIRTCAWPVPESVAGTGTRLHRVPYSAA